MTALPTISIIFPIHNGLSDTQECLSSIQQLTYPHDKLEVLLIDNASTDNSLSVISHDFPFVTVLHSDTNLGFAKAINLGARNATGEYLFITNNDVVFEKDFFERMVSTFTKHRNIGALGALTFYKDKQTIISSSGYRFHFWTGRISSLTPQPSLYKTDWVQGCCLFTPRRIFKRFKGFDERFFFTFEDADYCFRLTKSTLSVMIDPTIRFYHAQGNSIRRRSTYDRDYLWHSNKNRFLMKHAQPFQLVTTFFLQLFVYSPLKALFGGHSYRAVWAAFITVFRERFSA